jgi:hypothetical protein
VRRANAQAECERSTGVDKRGAPCSHGPQSKCKGKGDAIGTLYSLKEGTPTPKNS